MRIAAVDQTIAIDIVDEIIPEWCLNLCLLFQGLIQSFVVVDDKNSFKLEISKNPNILPSQRGIVKWNIDKIELQLTSTELEVWLHYFLKYHRDDMAEVDHLDLNIGINGKKELALTLKVARALPAVSAQEARQRLGLAIDMP